MQEREEIKKRNAEEREKERLRKKKEKEEKQEREKQEREAKKKEAAVKKEKEKKEKAEAEKREKAEAEKKKKAEALKKQADDEARKRQLSCQVNIPRLSPTDRRQRSPGQSSPGRNRPTPYPPRSAGGRTSSQSSGARRQETESARQWGDMPISYGADLPSFSGLSSVVLCDKEEICIYYFFFSGFEIFTSLWILKRLCTQEVPTVPPRH